LKQRFPSKDKSPLAPLCQRGEHSRDTCFSPLYEERGVRGDFFKSSTYVFSLNVFFSQEDLCHKPLKKCSGLFPNK